MNDWTQLKDFAVVGLVAVLLVKEFVGYLKSRDITDAVKQQTNVILELVGEIKLLVGQHNTTRKE